MQSSVSDRPSGDCNAVLVGGWWLVVGGSSTSWSFLRSFLEFPESRVSANDTGGCDLEHGGVPDGRRVIPIRERASTLAALRQHLECARRNVQPDDGQIGSLTIGQRQLPQMREVRRGSEPEVEMLESLETRSDLPVDAPRSLRRAVDRDINGLLADESSNASPRRTPCRIAVEV